MVWYRPPVCNNECIWKSHCTTSLPSSFFLLIHSPLFARALSQRKKLYTDNDYVKVRKKKKIPKPGAKFAFNSYSRNPSFIVFSHFRYFSSSHLQLCPRSSSILRERFKIWFTVGSAALVSKTFLSRRLLFFLNISHGISEFFLKVYELSVTVEASVFDIAAL